MRLSLIVAMTRKGVIGRDGGLPWRLSADLKRFKALTMGHHIIMGRKTFESLGKLLPGRVMVVLKRLASPYDYDCFQNQQRLPTYDEVVSAREKNQPIPENFVPVAFVHKFDEALRLAKTDEETFVIGGGEIFELALPQSDRMYVTWVEEEVAGDVHFPAVDWAEWREVSRESHSADAKNDYDTTFVIYDRVLP